MNSTSLDLAVAHSASLNRRPASNFQLRTSRNLEAVILACTRTSLKFRLAEFPAVPPPATTDSPVELTL